MGHVQIVLAGLLLAVITSEAGAAGLLVPRDGSAPIAVKSHRVTASIEDGLARTTLRQTFVNPHRRQLEAVYAFPLPDGAALIDVAMEVDGKRLEGLLAERKRARKVYDDIVRSRRDPALVEQIGKSSFRLSVFPVVPNIETVVELTWIQHVPLRRGEYRYVYPLALGKGETVTEQDFTFSLDFLSSVPIAGVESQVEGLDVVRIGPGEISVSFERMQSRLDADVVVSAKLESQEPSLVVKTFKKANGDGWFLAVVTPPLAKEGDLVPRDVILVVDTSGSMSGKKIEQARASAHYLLANLRPEDRVNVLRFSTDVEAFASEPVPPTKEQLVGLTGFVNSFMARGGTALGDALKAALDVPAAEGRVRTVVLLTDGLPTVGVTSPAKIVEIAADGGKRGLRVFTFGVGNDVNPALLAGVSRASRGSAEVFAPEGEIQSRLRRFLDRTASPVLANVALTVEGVETRDIYPRPIPDAYLGEQVVLTGRYRGAGTAKVTASATLGKKRVSLVREAEFQEMPGGAPAAAWLFAREKLDFLEEAMRLRTGLDDAAYFAALDRGAYSTRDEIVAEIIRVSLEHGIQSAYASFIVLLPEDRRRIDPRDLEALSKAVRRVKETTGRVAQSGEEPDAPERSARGNAGGGTVRGNAGARSAPAEEAGTGGGEDGGDAGGSSGSSGGGAVGMGGAAAPGGPTGKRPATPAPATRPAAVNPPRWTVPEFYAGRSTRDDLRKLGGTKNTEAAVKLGLEWLAKHQDPSGKFDADGHMAQCKLNQCDGVGKAGNDIGVTGLTALAFLGAGNTPFAGEHRDTVLRAVLWLMTVQTEDGCFGSKTDGHFVYGHAIAAQAVAEAYGMTGSPFLKHSAQRAIDFIHRAQNPYLAWRYGVRPGDNDSSVTAFMLSALKSAKAAGLEVDQSGFDGAKAWLEKATEPEYGRVGYTSRGTGPARSAGLMDKYPGDKSESLTAAGILCRAFCGEDPTKSEMIAKGADLCTKALPVWDEASGSIDMYYWYFGSMALFQVGGDPWKHWNQAMIAAAVDSQRRDGDEKGSWDPVGAWGADGGRIYSTAMMTMCLETYYRYPTLFKVKPGRGRFFR